MAGRTVLLPDLALGAMLIATIAFAVRRPQFRPSRARRVLGWLLIAIPLPVVVAFHLGEGVFVAGVVSFAVGAMLVLAGDDVDDFRRHSDSEPPPWWPEFERAFRAYARRQRRPRVRV